MVRTLLWDVIRAARSDREERAYLFKMSPKRYTPSAVCRTDRTAEENMCVTGEVTLMDSRPAMQMRKPTMPWGERCSRYDNVTPFDSR